MRKNTQRRLQNSFLGRYIDFDTKPQKPSSKRLTFTMATMMLCFGIGAYIGCVDWMSLPRTDSFEWLSENPDYMLGLPEFEDKSRALEWDMGNGFMSNLETAVMLLSMFFGFLRLLDMLMLFERLEKYKRYDK
jgi:hypothetical protein